MNTLLDIATMLRDASHIAITAHVRPDGDALGSCLGLLRILRALGKTATVLDLGPIPDRYRFLLADGECRDADGFDFTSADCIVVLDSGAIDRAAAFVADNQETVPIINIDHHLSNTNFGRLNVVDTSASSVGEMVCNLAREAGFPIPPAAAEALWVAIVTDTGRFSYSNTTPNTMKAAADLLQTGIQTAEMNHAIYNAMPLRQLRLQGRALEHLETHEEARVALVTLSRDDYAELGCTAADAEDIVNIPRSLEGVEVAIFLYEILDSDETKVSLRTNEGYDASAFCQKLGGGGHARAAGCSLAESLDDARKTILEHVHNQWFSE
jgi:bifunctional oligoribonuclease and PAP phosphatase NrnA